MGGDTILVLTDNWARAIFRAHIGPADYHDLLGEFQIELIEDYNIVAFLSIDYYDEDQRLFDLVDYGEEYLTIENIRPGSNQAELEQQQTYPRREGEEIRFIDGLDPEVALHLSAEELFHTVRPQQTE